MNFKKISVAMFMVGVLMISGYVAYSAIVTTFDYSSPGDYILDSDYNQEINAGEIILGDQFEALVNDPALGFQFDSKILSLGNNQFLVAWEGFDGAGLNVYGKIVDKFGREITPEFTVNQVTPGNQSDVDIVLLDNGNIMFVFTSNNTDGVDGDGFHIAATVYDQEGTIVVPEFTVNELFQNSQSFPDIAKQNDGNVFITWRSGDTSDPADTINQHIAAKIVAPDGSTVLNEFVVNETATDTQQKSFVYKLEASNPVDDKIIVIWQSGPSASLNLYAKIYNYDGTVSRSEYVLLSDSVIQDMGDLVKVRDDVFFVVYQSWNSAFGTDNDGTHIGGFVIDLAGNVTVPAFTLNEEIEGDQLDPSLTLLSNENVYIVWDSEDSNHSGTDNDVKHIASKVMSVDDSGGLSVSTVSSEMQVNVLADGEQNTPDVVYENGDIVHVFFSGASNARYSDDTDQHIAILTLKEDFSYYKSIENPSHSLNDGVIFNNALREIDLTYSSFNEGEVRLQLSNNNGGTWYYYDGTNWSSTTVGAEESNTFDEINDNLKLFFQQVGTGQLNVKLYLVSDGEQEVGLTSFSLSENERPVIGAGDLVVDYDVPQNRTFVSNISVIDNDNDVIDLVIAGGDDQNLFALDDTGRLFISLDGERGETYEVIVRATDEFGEFTEQTINVSVVRVPPSNGASNNSAILDNAFEESYELDEPFNEDYESQSNGRDEVVKYPELTRNITVTPKGEYCIEDFKDEYSKLNSMNRIDAVRLIMDILCIDVSKSLYLKEFKDTRSLSDLEKSYINKAYEIRLIQGYPDGTFRPYNKLNYAEISALLYRSLYKDQLMTNPWFVEYVKVVNLVSEERLDEYVSYEDYFAMVSEFYEF